MDLKKIIKGASDPEERKEIPGDPFDVSRDLKERDPAEKRTITGPDKSDTYRKVE